MELPLDSFEVLEFVAQSLLAKWCLLLVLLSFASFTWMVVGFFKRQAPLGSSMVLAGSILAICFIGIFISWHNVQEQYAQILLASENDQAAEAGCRYFIEKVPVERIQRLLTADRNTANTRFYLAVAIVLKDRANADGTLSNTRVFERPYFFGSNSFNNIKRITWPASGKDLHGALAAHLSIPKKD
ncbi:MAG: hypothetical protein WCO56_00795 [Verrucomicrobiota bacterium]